MILTFNNMIILSIADFLNYLLYFNPTDDKKKKEKRNYF